MHCVQVHDMKDQIHNLAVTESKFCYIPQGAGVKVVKKIMEADLTTP